MANDNHASFAKIGFIVCAGLAAIVAVLIYIGGMGGNRSEVLIETCYDNSVPGLSIGSPVNLRGIKIGEVRKICPVGYIYNVPEKDAYRIYILMAIDRELLGADEDEDLSPGIAKAVNELGLRATVTSSGITGLSRLELDFNMVDAPVAPEITWTPKHAYVPAKLSMLENLSVAATKAMNQFNKMDFGSVWKSVQNSAQSLELATENLKSIMDANKSGISEMVRNITEATVSMNELMRKLEKQPSLLIREPSANTLEETAR